MEVEQRYAIKFFVEEGMKGVEIINMLTKYYCGDALQRMKVYYWIKEVKSGKNDSSNVPPPARAPDDGLDDCIAKALKEDLHLSPRKIV
jgi:hypothetical protein